MRPPKRTGKADLPLRVGLIGCGGRADACLRAAPFAPSFRVVAVADLFAPTAARLGAAHGLPAVGVLTLLLDPAVDMVLNLAAPADRALVAAAAAAAGKPVCDDDPCATIRAAGHPNRGLAGIRRNLV